MSHANETEIKYSDIRSDNSKAHDSYAILTTEEINQESLNIDECNTIEMLEIINNQDSLVHAAVRKEIPKIAQAVDIIYEALKNEGRMVYIGAGTSGRLGILDASECPPTYSTDPDMVQAYIAGGDIALRTAVEGCEDNRELGIKLVHDAEITSNDVVIGITASGGAPFVLAAIQEAKKIGAATIGVVNNKNSKLSKLTDVCIAPIVGPEVIIGSTRMKSGTAQKMVLNMLTTCTMIKMGKVYGNLMVDLKASNMKLIDRAKRIICSATGIDMVAAEKYLELSKMQTKLAILMVKTGLDFEKADELLKKCEGSLKKAIAFN